MVFLSVYSDTSYIPAPGARTYNPLPLVPKGISIYNMSVPVGSIVRLTNKLKDRLSEVGFGKTLDQFDQWRAKITGLPKKHPEGYLVYPAILQNQIPGIEAGEEFPLRQDEFELEAFSESAISFKEFYLTEMPRGVPITDEEKLEIAEYIEAFPKDNYQKIADAFGVSRDTVYIIAKELKVGRGWSVSPQAHAARAAQVSALKGDEKAGRRLAKDTQEKQILDHWMANHHDMTLSELARWVKQQLNVVADRSSMANMLKRAAAKQVPPVQLPPSGFGKGRRLKKRRDLQKDKHAIDPTGVPTVRPVFRKGSTSTPATNPDHGGNPDVYPST